MDTTTILNENLLKMNTQVVLDKDALSKSLVSLSPHLSPSDKLKMALQFECSHATIVRYLNGEVRDAELANKIEEQSKVFIADRIAEQSKAIA